MTDQEKCLEILNKKFKKSIFSGYDMVDVDEFFDEVIKYVEENSKRVVAAEEIASKLKTENETLVKKVEELSQQLSIANTQIEEYKKNGYDNVIKNSQTQGEK